MTGDRSRLAGDAFHQIAIAAEAEDALVEESGATAFEACLEVLGGNRHPDPVGKALAEWTGRGLDSRGQMALGMPGGLAAELTETLEIIEREVIAGQIERAVEQHRAVSGGEYEAVAAVPARILRVMAHEAGEEQI